MIVTRARGLTTLQLMNPVIPMSASTRLLPSDMHLLTLANSKIILTRSPFKNISNVDTLLWNEKDAVS